MVDLTRDLQGRVHARSLDLVPGRSGQVYLDWLRARGPVFTTGTTVATLDPFHGYQNAIDDGLQDAVAVLDAFLPREREDPRSSSSRPPRATTSPAASSSRPCATEDAEVARCRAPCVARGFRNRESYRLRMLLIGGGLNHPRLL